jgi:hypothetical protein
MNLNKIATLLEATQIQNLEDIAKEVARVSPARTQECFDRIYAMEIVRQKLKNSGLAYQQFRDDFPYVIKKEGEIIVCVSPCMVSEPRKNAVASYARKTKKQLSGYQEMILFLPFQMNGTYVREIIQSEFLDRESAVGFVNLPYNQKALERRFMQYCTGQRTQAHRSPSHKYASQR